MICSRLGHKISRLALRVVIYVLLNSIELLRIRPIVFSNLLRLNLIENVV